MPVRMQTKKDTFTIDYPEARAFADAQAKTFWPHFEVKVEKDKQDMLVNMTPSESHATITALKLFTKYEQIIGDEFWLNFVYKKFPRPADIQPMAVLFAAMELQVHAPFYSKINEELGLATDKFYLGYLDDPVLHDRIKFLQNSIACKDDLRALGIFAFGEGAILYTSFAFLKHFQTKGKNKLLNTVSGINFSARDEDLHSQAAGWLFRTLMAEMLEAGLIDQAYIDQLEKDIIAAAHVVLEHEKAIIKKFFERGTIPGITEIQLEHFAEARINIVLKYLGFKPLFTVTYDPISEWFYLGTEGFGMIDFFNAQGNQYVRGWNEEDFDY